MENKLKNRTKKVLAIKNELAAALEKLSAETRIPQSRLMDEAIELLLRKHQGEK